MTLGPLSLRARVSVLLALAIIGVLGIAAWVIDARVDGELQRRFDTALAARAEALAALTRREPHGIEFDAAYATSVAQDSRVKSWYALSCDGHMLDAVPRGAVALLPPLSTSTTPLRMDDVQPADGHLARRATLVFHPGPGDSWPPDHVPNRSDRTRCVVILAQERRRLDQTLDAVDAILVGSILAALLAVLALTPALVRAGLRPLSELADAMRDIGPHTPGRRLDIPPTPELDPLQARFNEVLARMDAGLARERQFASAVAHETRTRLAELRALVDVERRYPSGRPVRALLDEIGEIGSDLEQTVAGLLLLTRLEAGTESIDPRYIDLDELIERHVARIAPTLQRRNLRVSIGPAANGSALIADPSLLDIIVSNVLGNASNHAPENSVIDVDPSMGALAISNDAPELDAREIEHFGQRFWSTRHDQEGHVGLGLSLAGAAAAALGLRLCFALDDAHRLRATLQWKSDTQK
ncbi:MAG: HAMP domain-containing sensor histidine kinase [Rhodanobacteraceae bacterium]